MFDSEKIKEELWDCIKHNPLAYNLDEIIENYKIIEGFYVFRTGDDAQFFQNNTFIETAVGYYAINKGGNVGGQ